MDFKEIDIGIDTFITGKNMRVLTDPSSDWLVYEWRQLTWMENGTKYLIEIFPNFNMESKIKSWSLYTAAYYDLNKKRHYINKEFAKEVALDFISQNISALLNDSFNYISCLDRSDIPFAVELSGR